jgi:hypothetical protein
MNQIGPDGIKNYVHNPNPDGFDLSRVFRPAERTGFTLKKVAHVYELRSSAELGEAVDEMERKSAAIRKLCDIDKVVRGEPIASASTLAPDEQTVIRRFRDYAGPRLHAPAELPIAELLARKPAEVLSTLSSAGIILTTPEFLRYMVSQLAGRPVAFDDAMLRRATALQPQVFSLLAESPGLLDELLSTGILDEHPANVDGNLHERLAPFTEKRSAVGEMLYRRLVPEGIGLRSDEAPRTDVLNFRDPSTGHAYQTTRGAAIDAQDAVTRADINKLVGGAALLGGAYKALTAFPSLREHKLPLGIGAGLAGWKLLRPGMESSLRTEQGLEMPDITEWSQQPKQASESLPAIVVSLIDDYQTLTGGAPPTSKIALDQRVMRGAYVDSLKGTRLDLDAVSEAIGATITS